MAQPLPYERDFDFEGFQSGHPSTPLPGDKIDLELDQVAETTNQIRDRIARLQDDDLALKRKSVGFDQLKDELNGFGFNPPSEWATATGYAVRDTVFEDAGFYRCLVAHTSGVFADDLAAGRWELVADFTAATTDAQTAATAAQTAQAAAETAETTAVAAKNQAVTSAANAATSESSAAGSAASAAASATVAQDAASNLEDAVSAAASSAAASQSSAAASATSAAAAAESESQAAAIVAGALQSANNLSDVADAAASRGNLGLSDGATAAFSTQSQAEAGTDNLTVLTPLRLTQKLKKDGYLSIYQMGVSDPSADNDTAIDTALAEAFPILFPAAQWNCGQPLTVRKGGGILGYGEMTQFMRQFTGGAVVEFGGGSQLGDPIRLENFRVSLGGSVPFANLTADDFGARLGFVEDWAGRGNVANLIFEQQYEGFKWKGGTTQPIYRVYAINCVSDGFNGINPRGELLQCFSGTNGGRGFTTYQETTGETGCYLNGCTTFSNAYESVHVTGAAGQLAANQYIRHHVSSFDNGGVIVDGTVVQVSIDDLFAEYMGQAHLNNPLATQNLTAVGLYLGPNVKSGKATSLQIMNGNGHALWLDQCQGMTISTMAIEGNGKQFASNGGNGAGVLNNGRNCSLIGYTANPDNANAQADVNVQSGATGRMSGFTGALTWQGTATGLVVKDCSPDRATITIASTVTLPQVGDTFIFSGSGTVDQITPSFEGREVTILAGAAITIGSTGNVFLVSSYTMAVGATLKLKMIAGNWREIGRTSPRAS